ncbi:hypothetical protein RU98_GL003131 [Enterococcus caccae]|nr:hypothetical protein RU98_GL003131 [Enterococcus caccae]
MLGYPNKIELIFSFLHKSIFSSFERNSIVEFSALGLTKGKTDNTKPFFQLKKSSCFRNFQNRSGHKECQLFYIIKLLSKKSDTIILFNSDCSSANILSLLIFELWVSSLEELSKSFTLDFNSSTLLIAVFLSFSQAVSPNTAINKTP